MEELNLKIEKIAGGARDDAECSVVNKKIILQSGEVGNLACCLLVTKAQDSDAQNVMRDILEIAERRLDESSGALLETFKDIILSSGTYVEGQPLELSFLMTFFYRNVCYVARFGNDVKLVAFGDSKKASIDFEVGSGPVLPGFTYLIATSKFLSMFDDGTFKREDIDLSEVIDGLATEITSKEDQAEIGAVFIKCLSKVNVVDESVDDQTVQDLKEDVVGSEDTLATAVAADSGASEQGVDMDSRDGAERHANLESGSDEIVVDQGGIEQAGEQEYAYSQGNLDNGYEDKNMSEVGEYVDEGNTQRPNIVGAILGGITGFLGKVFGEIKNLRAGDVTALLRLRRNILGLVVIIAIVLGGFIGYNVWQKGQESQEKEMRVHLDAARSKLNEGSAILELNKSRARQFFVEAQEEAKKAQVINGKDQDVLKILEEISARLKDSEVTSNVNLTTFAELESDLVSLSYNGTSKIEAFGVDKIYDLDNSGKVLADHEVEGGISGGVSYDNKAFVLTGSGAKRVDLPNDKVVDISTVSGILDIGVFFGNVYLLLSDQVVKVVPIESGYAEPKDYLASKESFGANSRLAIDSLVWITNGNKVFKYNRGAKEDFEISGLPEGSGDFGLIYTDSSLNNLYVVDKKNSALLVIDKDGKYQKALSSSEFGKATGIIVNPSEDKLFVAVDSKILTTGLK